MADSSVFFCHLGARWISLVLNWLLGLLTLFSEKLANFQVTHIYHLVTIEGI